MNDITSQLKYVIAPIFFSAQQEPMIRATIAELAGCGIATVAIAQPRRARVRL